MMFYIVFYKSPLHNDTYQRDIPYLKYKKYTISLEYQ